jgi:hypothetical protein
MADQDQTPAPAPAPQPEVFSKEYVKELRAENSGWRLKHKEASDAKEAAEAAAKAAAVAAEAKVSEVTKSAEQRIIRSELKAHAVKAGIVDLDGLKLVDLSGVKLDENGDVVGADALIESLKKAKPYLFGTPASSTTQAAPSKDAPPAKKATEMSAEEYAAARAAVTKR